MSDFINTYNNRKHEIQNFIIFMEYIENTEVNGSDSKLHGFIHSTDNDLTYQSLINTLKSNFSLMLYNILEYTVSGLLDELYTEISINNLSYIDVSEKIQTIWHKVKLNDANKNSAGFDTLLAKSKYILDSVIDKNTITLSSRDTITGYIRFKKEEKSGSHESIISTDTFKKVQKILTQKHNSRKRKNFKQ